MNEFVYIMRIITLELNVNDLCLNVLSLSEMLMTSKKSPKDKLRKQFKKPIK